MPMFYFLNCVTLGKMWALVLTQLRMLISCLAARAHFSLVGSACEFLFGAKEEEKMEIKEAFETLGLQEGEDFKKISDTYYDMLKALLTPNGEQWFKFEEEGKKITLAYFTILNTPKYQKEKALLNFWQFIKNYKMDNSLIKEIIKEVNVESK